MTLRHSRPPGDRFGKVPDWNGVASGESYVAGGAALNDLVPGSGSRLDAPRALPRVERPPTPDKRKVLLLQFEQDPNLLLD